jgi:uncharacterized repeat protein (TIGR03803 family)
MLTRIVRRMLGVGTAFVALVGLSGTPRAGELSVVASFNLNDATGAPFAGVTFDTQGNMYGTTGDGNGTLWTIPSGSQTVTVISTFTSGGYGYFPAGGVALDGSGNIFGTAMEGGGFGWGTVFGAPAGGGAPTLLASFSSATGNPLNGPVLDNQGNLYGTSWNAVTGSGTVWELGKGSNSIVILASFNGSIPVSGVTIDSQGNLYGTTNSGGANNSGTIWELTKGSNTITTLASFGPLGPNDGNGFFPSGVAMNSHGNLFGTTYVGGANDDGTVWELAKGSNTITTLASFDGADGSLPNAGVTLDASGNLYGTASGGGASSDGTLFELAAGSHTITTLADFNGTNGSNPYSSVTFGPDGALYGTAANGGSQGAGTVWKYTASAVPEPSSIVTGLIALAMVGGFAMVRRARAAG